MSSSQQPLPPRDLASPAPLTEEELLAHDLAYVEDMNSGAIYRREAASALALDHQHGIGVL